MGISPITGTIIRGRFGHRDTPRDEGGRDWSDAAPSQGMPRVPGNLQELGERDETGCPSGFPEGTNPDNTLIWDF